jgi:hypothetical protein
LNILGYSGDGGYKYNTKHPIDKRVSILCFLIVNKKIPFFSRENARRKRWLTIIFLSIVVFLIGATFIALVIIIGEINTIPTTTGTVFSARKEYVGSFCV